MSNTSSSPSAPLFINLGIGNAPPPPISSSSSSSSSTTHSSTYYLTSDATDILWKVNPNAKYIVGGIVDRNRFPQLALNRAKGMIGVKTVRFPLDESLAQLGHMHRHRILTTNKAVELLAEVIMATSGVERRRDRHAKKMVEKGEETKGEEGVEDGVDDLKAEDQIDINEQVVEDQEELNKEKKTNGKMDVNIVDIMSVGKHTGSDTGYAHSSGAAADDKEMESLRLIWRNAIDKILLTTPSGVATKEVEKADEKAIDSAGRLDSKTKRIKIEEETY